MRQIPSAVWPHHLNELLFDANLAPALVERLADVFPGSAHVYSFGLEDSDTSIWNHAKAEGYVIVSKDSDFHQRAFVLGPPPKVIWIRLGNCRTPIVESLLCQRRIDIEAFNANAEEWVLALP